MKKLFLIGVLLIPCKSWAASCSNTNISNGWTCVFSASVGNTATMTTVNSSGSNLLYFVVSDFGMNPSCTPSDTIGGNPSGNTWTSIATINDSSLNSRTTVWYVASSSPAVGASHVITCSTGAGGALAFAGFKLNLAPFDQKSTGQNQSSATIQAGSITPSQNNALIVAAVGFNITTLSSIDSSFTIAENQAAQVSVHQGVGLAYITQSTAAAVNPTWTMGATVASSAVITSFNQLPSATGVSQFMLVGMGR